MAKFRVTGPDGGTFEVTAPDDASEQQVMDYVRSQAPTPKAVEPAKPEPSLWDKTKDVFTGSLRTEFPDAQEFLPAVGASDGLDAVTATNRAAITPDQNAQVDILRKQIPGLETKADAHGNLMLKTPKMTEWAYLNKPGFSSRDIDEIGTQTLAALPFLGVAGAGTGLATKVATGAGAMAASSVAQDAAAIAQGSEQGVSGERALISGAVGAAAPLVAPAIDVTTKAVKSIASPVTNTVRGLVNPEAEALRRVQSAASRDFQTAQTTGTGKGLANVPDKAIRDAGRQGQPIRAVDMGETTRALARSASNTSPEGRAIINDAVQGRYQLQSDRVAGFLETLSPFKGSTFQLSETIARVAKDARKPFYERAYREGSKGVWNETLDSLARTPAVQKAIARANEAIKNKLEVGRVVPPTAPFKKRTVVEEHKLGPLKSVSPAAREALESRDEFIVVTPPTLEFWDAVKRGLDDQIGIAQKAGEKSAAADATAIKHALVKELDSAVPAYAEARGVAGTYFKADNALEAGENFVEMRAANGEAAHAFSKLSPNEQILFRQGYTQTLINDLRATGDTRNALNRIMHSPTDREKMKMVLGANDAKRLEAFLRIEGIMDLARGALGNSTTARQLAEMGLAGGAYNASTGTTPWSDPVGFFTSALIYGGARAGIARIDQRVARQVAELLVTDDPKRLAQAVKTAQQPYVLNALRAFDEDIGPRLARNATAAQVAQPEQEQPKAEPQRLAALDAMMGPDEENDPMRDIARVMGGIDRLNPSYEPGPRQSANVEDRRGEELPQSLREKLVALLLSGRAQ